MENLRLILLVAGIIFILAIYLIGRQRRNQNSSDIFDSKENLPDFSAREWEDLDEGVGEVRIVARENDVSTITEEFPVDSLNEYNDKPDAVIAEELEVEELKDDEQETSHQNEDLFELTEETEQPQNEVHHNDDQKPQSSNIDIIVLYILAKSPDKPLTGDGINSAAQANGLEFGRMDIFHRLDENGLTLFSMANMIEPGNFDPDSIHELKTSGLTMFMQLSNLSSPSDSFDEMLRCAYHISEMLGASLCNQKRQPITQADAEYYRNIIAQKENN